jgi:hypothetical protein
MTAAETELAPAQKIPEQRRAARPRRRRHPPGGHRCAAGSARSPVACRG